MLQTLQYSHYYSTVVLAIVKQKQRRYEQHGSRRAFSNFFFSNMNGTEIWHNYDLKKLNNWDSLWYYLVILQINKYHIMFTSMQSLLSQLHLSENTLLNGGIYLTNFQVLVNGGKKLHSFSFLVLLLITVHR